MKIKTLIIDDEVRGSQVLAKLLERYPEIELLGAAHSADEGIVTIQRLKPDLVFLDIQMPGKTGFDMLTAMPEVKFEVIFVTGYDQYAIQAFKFGAIDYLLKPVDVDDLDYSVEKVINRIKKKDTNHSIELLLQNIRTPKNDNMQLALPTQEGVFYIPISEIIRCESDGSYTVFHLSDKKKIIVSKNVKEYEELLTPYHFCRVHNQHLINLRHVKKYVKGEGGFAIMSDNYEVEVARRRKEDFLIDLGKITLR
ncbi:LytR/AlgR family response regulator transcription factor [Emticicia fontis]